MLTEEQKWNYINCSVKPREARERGKKKKETIIRKLFYFQKDTVII